MNRIDLVTSLMGRGEWSRRQKGKKGDKYVCDYTLRTIVGKSLSRRK